MKDKVRQEIQEYADRLGRLPSVREAGEEIRRDRTLIHAILREMRGTNHIAPQRNDAEIEAKIDGLEKRLGSLAQELSICKTKCAQYDANIVEIRIAFGRLRRSGLNDHIALAILASAMITDVAMKEHEGRIAEIGSGKFEPVVKRLLHHHAIEINDVLARSCTWDEKMAALIVQEAKCTGGPE